MNCVNLAVVLTFLFVNISIAFGDSNAKCFVGFAAGNLMPYVTGDELDCVGSCANLTLNVYNSPMSIFFCDSENLCDDFNATNTCQFINKGLSMCCCGNETYCNIKQTLNPISPTSDTTAIPSPVIKCFIGFDLINPQTSLPSPSSSSSTSTSTSSHKIYGEYSPCQGDCANISLNAYGNLYLCDPIQLCTTLQMKNNCSLVDQLLTGCCCTTPLCNYLNTSDSDATPLVVTTVSNSTPTANINVLSCLILCFFVWVNFLNQ